MTGICRRIKEKVWGGETAINFGYQGCVTEARQIGSMWKKPIEEKPGGKERGHPNWAYKLLLGTLDQE